jgi:hypothetical protein
MMFDNSYWYDPLFSYFHPFNFVFGLVDKIYQGLPVTHANLSLFENKMDRAFSLILFPVCIN